MTFLELLEHKHFGRLDPKIVFKYANTSAEFSSQWLVQAIRSDCSFKELALAVAANIKWDTAVLKTLRSYLNFTSTDSHKEDQEIESAIAYSKDIFGNINELKLKEVLIELKHIDKKVSLQNNLDEHKYTCCIDILTEHIESIVDACKPHLKDVTLFGDQGKNSKDESIRNNTHFPTPLPNDSIALALLEKLIAKASGHSIRYAEPPFILRYEPEQYYKWHYDHIYPHTKAISEHTAQFGQRVTTAIFYFNDNFLGGDTEFKQPFLSVNPKKNHVLVFENCDEFEKRHNSSLHRGTTVKEGEKWIMTLWFRNKSFWLRSGLL